MRPTEICRAWVVYRMTLCKYTNAVGGNVVCEQREWDAIESAEPGLHSLIRAGIKTEQEAEKLARGTAGDAKPRKLWQVRKAARLRRQALDSTPRPSPAGSARRR
jgi:hypothetical protein